LVNERLREMLEIEEPLLGAGDWRATGLRERLPGDIFENPDSTEGATEFETTINGQNRSFLYSVAEIGAEKEHIGSALVIYDYTRQKELEEEAARRVRLAELGDLAAGVAHEIRNPLNAISLAAQRLDSEFSPAGDSEKSDFSFFTSQIKNETGRLNEIVTRLLGLTRVPKTEAKMADVGAIVEEWARFMEAEFNRDRAHVSLELGENAQARVDADKLRQALGNLYRNSKEAAPDQSPLNVDIQLRREESSLSIVFSDNGPGITTEAVERLFTPYYTTKESGSGLGLSISYRLVTDMGGSLELDKSYTGGARFVITLPTREE
ncbi:MAG: PAS domain-containing sensor histidine kinase, partial [Candidatus Zixiibacteriota bacterium]